MDRARFNQTTEEAENQKRQKQLRNWQQKDLIEASHDPTRMSWLYNTLTRYGNLHEFSPAAKEWVKSKVATEDIASRSEDPVVIDPWWEDEMTPQRRASFHNNTLPTSSQTGHLHLNLNALGHVQPLNSPLSPRKTISEGPGSPLAAGSDGSFGYRPTLAEVVVNPLGISELAEALDVEGLSLHFDFLAAVAQLKQGCTTTPDQDCMEIDIQRAHDILTQFLTKNGSTSIYNELPSTAISVAYTAISPKNKIKTAVLLAAFDPCVEDIKRTLTPLWDEFRQTDDYLQLCAQLDPAAQKPLPTQNANLLLQISGSETFSQAGIPQLLQWWPYRAPSWMNHHGYQSIKVTIHSCKGPLVQRYAGTLYCVFASGSRLLKHAAINTSGDFNLTCPLPICNTTQYIWLMIGAQGKCLGVLPLAMSDLAVARQDGPISLKLRTESNPGTLDDTLREKVQIPPGQTNGGPQSISGSDEIIFSYQLLTEVSQSENLDGFKHLFADDTASGSLGDFIRGKVSKKKKRFAEDNFNLDLTYITPTVIAMGFPSEGAEGVYRNPLKQVQQFFALRHPQAYRIYNLCSERSYDPAKFDSRCEHYPFDDHNPPPFTMMRSFCESVRKFLAESPQNVVSIHCKAGKGRTGTMIAAYLIYAAGLTAPQALHQFGTVRTSNGQGVTISSQIQYVHYFDHYCALRRAQKPGPGRTTLFLESVALRSIGSKFNNSEIQWTISIPNVIYDSNNNKIVETGKPITITPQSKPIKSNNGNSYIWPLDGKLLELHEDVRFEFITKAGMSKEKLLHCWINTRLMKLTIEDGKPVARIYKPWLDKAAKDTKHKKFDQDFHLELIFSSVETAAQKRLDLLSVPGRPELTSVTPE